MTTPQQIAEAFSGHRFAEAYEHLAEDVNWVLVGETVLRGRAAVVEACEASTAELDDVTTTFERFVTIAGADAVAIDVIGRYVDGSGSVTAVSSCDIYEFTDGSVTTITSYTVDVTEQ